MNIMAVSSLKYRLNRALYALNWQPFAWREKLDVMAVQIESGVLGRAAATEEIREIWGDLSNEDVLSDFNDPELRDAIIEHWQLGKDEVLQFADTHKLPLARVVTPFGPPDTPRR